MVHVMHMIALSGMLAFNGSAQLEDTAVFMTCSDFAALAPEDRLSATEALLGAAGEMATDKMMPGLSGTADPPLRAAAESTAIADTVTALLRACDGNPDMMVMDAMMEQPGT